MDSELLVDQRIEDGRELLANLVTRGFAISVSFWIRTSEEDLWFLYIASPKVGRVSIGDAYRDVYTALSRVAQTSITISDIKLVSPDNPIALDAIAVRNRFPSMIPISYTGKRMGQLAIEEALIYPPVGVGMDRDQVLRTVTQLMNRSGQLQPSLITLRNGTSLQAIPLGVQVQQPGKISVALRNISSGCDEIHLIDEISDIQ
ncbi:MAG TPA: hypothetical protein VIM11_27025 [Tepidisphaeraceae bacterium]|jgi:hypothetical protein